MSTPLDRRRVLAGGLGGLGALGAAALAGSCGRARVAFAEEPILVLLELFGGMDGLSTVVPMRDDAYHRARPTTRLAPEEVLPLRHDRGLHPALAHLRARFDRGEVAIVEGAGYPGPIYSHFRALDVWHTARHEGRASGPGWIGRLRDGPWDARSEPELVAHVGSEAPWSVRADEHAPLEFGSAETFRPLGRAREELAIELAAEACTQPEERAGRAAAVAALRGSLSTVAAVCARVQEAVRRYRPRVEYPDEFLAHKLRTIAAMIDAGFATRVYSLAHGNYDTHGGVQKPMYARLHGALDVSLEAFLADLARGSRGRDVAVLAFSEFGRRVHENESFGTDHGAAVPMLVVGAQVRGGFYGRHPSLEELDGDLNLVHTVDFRRAYAAVLEGWFGVRSETVLPERYEPLPIFG